MALASAVGTVKLLLSTCAAGPMTWMSTPLAGQRGPPGFERDRRSLAHSRAGGIGLGFGLHRVYLPAAAPMGANCPYMLSR
jgi:hypothetical protein